MSSSCVLIISFIIIFSFKFSFRNSFSYKVIIPTLVEKLNTIDSGVSITNIMAIEFTNTPNPPRGSSNYVSCKLLDFKIKA